MTVEATVSEFFKAELGKDVLSVGRNESLLESGTIDSVAVMKLVSFLEETYNIKVDDDDLVPENFDTLAAIIAFVERRRSTGHG